MKIKDNLIKLKDILFNALYPTDIKCIFCGCDIPTPTFICKDCLNEEIFNEGNRCLKCDTPIKEENSICDHCKKSKRHFEKVYCPFKYDGKVRKALLKFKSDGAKYLARPFATFISHRLEQEEVDFDIIVPVPSFRKTIRQRGYNPARVLADELSKITSKPVEDILYKVIQTKNQKYLSYDERQSNLENSIMLLNNSVIKGKNILIIDDIITTGATAEACAKLLNKANIIYVCAVARRS